MNWDAIRYYLALIETPTLADAAASLGVSDATVMRRIQSLEASLHTTLFVRTHKGHIPTTGGERIMAAAREMEAVAHKIRHDIAGEDEALVGNVMIATTEFGADYVLGPSLSDFNKRYPNLTLTLHVSPDHFDLLQPDTGLALRFQRPEQGPYLISKIGEVSWGLYVAKPTANELGLAEGDYVRGSEPFIGWAPPVDNIKVAQSTLRIFAKGRAIVNVPTLRGQIEAARSGLGVAHIPCILGNTDVELIRLQSAERQTVLEAWLVQPQQYSHQVRMNALADFVRQSMANVAD